LLSRSRIDYFAPADGRATGLEPNSIDLVYSNSVLEHVPREEINGLMEESFRVLRPGGIIMHNIGCNDHYAFFDRSISPVNFLQFGEREWRLWNNPIQYQNRLRAPEFLDLVAHAGFEVICKRTHVRPGTLDVLKGLRIAPQFDRFSRDELAATSVDLIGRKPAR
jgi:SAM-dependent methyltransferase